MSSEREPHVTSRLSHIRPPGHVRARAQAAVEGRDSEAPAAVSHRHDETPAGASDVGPRVHQRGNSIVGLVAARNLADARVAQRGPQRGGPRPRLRDRAREVVGAAVRRASPPRTPHRTARPARGTCPRSSGTRRDRSPAHRSTGQRPRRDSCLSRPPGTSRSQRAHRGASAPRARRRPRRRSNSSRQRRGVLLARHGRDGDAAGAARRAAVPAAAAARATPAAAAAVSAL